MERLVAGYVARSFERPELGYVYYTERINLPAADQAILHHVQRSTVESWTKLLLSARPEISPGHARFAVHAGFTLVVDLGRLVQYDNTEHAHSSADPSR
ncbi:transcriptional regulator [Mycobacteroides abscessus subsp. massiliense]|nr:transcriptional regulator [Mycobacteroides abscessus subsp. massiliense]